MRPQNILFRHVRQGETLSVTVQFASHTGWAVALTYAGLSAGTFMTTICAESGEMDYVQVQLPPFL